MSKTIEVNLFLSGQQFMVVKRLSRAEGISIESYIRNAIHYYTQREKVDNDANPYLKGAERNGFYPPESRHDET